MNPLSLNSEQQAAVNSTAPVTYVSSSPGSGKSRVIIARVAALVASGIDPKRLWLLTFTSAGAYVFKERLATLGITVGNASTLHSAMYRLVNQYGHCIGYNSGRVSLLGQEERDEIMETVLKKLCPKLTKKAVLENATPDAKLVNAEFRATLRRSNAVDYDGCLREGLALLKHPDVREALDIAEVLIDEAQDSGEEDWACFDALPAASRFIVFDSDQSIFAFRGAHPEIATARANDPNSTTLLLQTNYRSAAEICDSANRLIRHNRNRVEKWCLAREDAPMGEVLYFAVGDERAEIGEIIDRLDHVHSLGIPYSEMAVLARLNILADNYRQAIRSAGIPVKEPAVTQMPADWSLCLATVAMIHDPDNELVAKRWFRARGESAETVERIAREAKIAGMTIGENSNWPHAWRTDLTLIPGALVSEDISSESARLVESRITILPQSEPALADLIQDLMSHKTWDRGEEGEGVTVGTIHSVKGKEADCVIIGGCEEGILPAGGDIEEMRRLFFVGITRARQFLYLTSARQRNLYGKTTQQTESRFIQEIL